MTKNLETRVAVITGGGGYIGSGIAGAGPCDLELDGKSGRGIVAA
jgi:hypothetical protein